MAHPVEARRGVNAQQRAEYRQAIDACKRAKPVSRARPPQAPRRPRAVIVLPPRSEPIQDGTPEQLSLACTLLRHVSTYSVVDRRAHALGVARMILTMGGRP